MSDINSNPGEDSTTNGNRESDLPRIPTSTTTAAATTTTTTATGTTTSTSTNLLNENRKNCFHVVCQFCESKVLTPDVGEWRRLDDAGGRFLPAMRCKKAPPPPTRGGVVVGDSEGNNLPGVGVAEEPEGDVLDEFWVVEDMYHFENVGFSKAVNNVKYLICADCEMGPIGYHDPAQRPSRFYVALARVNHK